MHIPQIHNGKESEGRNEAVRRKFAAIIAADLFGYSRLVALDEEKTLKKLMEVRILFDRIVRHHGGRVFNTAGDAILAEFPSAVNCVRSAYAIQIAMRSATHNLDGTLVFRMGLNFGDVLEGANGDLFGDAVNVAARLEGAAIPGGICLSKVIYESVSGKLNLKFQDHGQKELKNIPQPVHIYSLLMPGEQPPKSISKIFLRGRKHSRFIFSILLIMIVYYSIQYIHQTSSTANTFEKNLKSAVADRDANGMNQVALAFYTGTGVQKDYEQAVTWWRKAADVGSPTAMLNLGLAYQNGKGVMQDYAQSRTWLHQAADNGIADAMADLGYVYGVGLGVARDPAESFRWSQMAANAGSPTGEKNLADDYFYGQGTDIDVYKAIIQYKRAANDKSKPAMEALLKIYALGEGVDKDPVEADRWAERAKQAAN